MISFNNINISIRIPTMTHYDDYDDFSLGSNFGSKVNNTTKKDTCKSCYNSKHVRKVISNTTKSPKKK